MTAQSIIDFWFDKENEKYWFKSTTEFDEKIRILFEDTYQVAVDGLLNDWVTTADGALALVILFDQFPLNMYRNEARSFQTEALSREVACQAIKNKLDVDMGPQKKSFLYLPFMHSENLQDQQLSVDLFSTEMLKDNLVYAIHHQKIIRQFGRFPHRNKILSRISTPDEEKYLKSSRAFLG